MPHAGFQSKDEGKPLKAASLASPPLKLQMEFS